MMKRMLFMACGLMLAALSMSAQETLFDGNFQVGGYGGVIARSASINGQFGLLGGGGGGVIIDRTVSLGGMFYSLVNDVIADSAPSSRPFVCLNYGGAFVQYIHNPDRLVHFTGSILVGAGSVGYRGSFDDFEDRGARPDTLDDAFFVVEPSIEAELNVTRWFRLGAGVGYRFVSGVERTDLRNSDIGGPSAALLFKFGSF